MKRFQNYPIYVNHPGRWEEVRQRQRTEFVDKGDYSMMTWLDSHGKRLYEIMEDKTQGPAEREYEERVIKLLMLIGSTRVGKLLFDSMNKNVQHWIVVLDRLDKIDCKCGAVTFPGQPKEGGGVRVYFNPTDWAGSAKRWFSADDILFHELVHAYRDGKFGYARNNFREMKEYMTAEEFVALQMQNVYLWHRGSERFYRSYAAVQTGKHVAVSKGTAYQSFRDDEEVLSAFRYFLDKDPLAGFVAQWMRPADSFNPWRDLPVLERLHSGKAIPSFGS